MPISEADKVSTTWSLRDVRIVVAEHIGSIVSGEINKIGKSGYYYSVTEALKKALVLDNLNAANGPLRAAMRAEARGEIDKCAGLLSLDTIRRLIRDEVKNARTIQSIVIQFVSLPARRSRKRSEKRNMAQLWMVTSMVWTQRTVPTPWLSQWGI